MLHDSVHTCTHTCAEIVAKKAEILSGQVKANMTKKLNGAVVEELLVRSTNVVRLKEN